MGERGLMRDADRGTGLTPPPAEPPPEAAPPPTVTRPAQQSGAGQPSAAGELTTFFDPQTGNYGEAGSGDTPPPGWKKLNPVGRQPNPFESYLPGSEPRQFVDP